jgi:phenylacetic acid degradation operon negative regulatory protein
VARWDANDAEAGVTAQPGRPIAEATLDAILAAQPVRAAGFIVTLYGDVVVPRGGEVWIGNIIETCAAVGISETLVRTAVSRLVAAGQLVSRSKGRRGFYRLVPEAEAEFAAAAAAIYAPEKPCGWRFVVLPEAGAEAQMAALERQGHARLRPQLAFGPDHAPPPAGTLVFPTRPEGVAELLTAFAASAFDLQTHADAYRAFMTRFAPLGREAGALAGPEALTARLLLVHAYRGVRLRDPRLPAEALPADWPGHPAREFFARTYLALAPAADSQIARAFLAVAGPLAASSATTQARHAQLAALALRAASRADQGVAGKGRRKAKYVTETQENHVDL